MSRVRATLDATGSPSTTRPVSVIRPTKGLSLEKLRQAWRQRELLYFFAVRDIKVRYAQTVFGAAWTIVQPLALMLVFTVAFQKVGRIQTAGVPYPVFALAGLTIWTFFTRSLLQGSESLVANVQLVTKTAAPRLLIPFSAVTSGLVDLTVSLLFLLAFTAAYGEFSGWELLALPLVLTLAVAFVLAPILVFSALNVRYRDVRHVLPFIVQVWLFLSPVAYPLSLLGEPWETIAALNPMVAIVEGFRWSFVGTDPPSAFAVGAAIAITAVGLVASFAYFVRRERALADVA
jgi:lipopolysaccharide transport system permease protein